MENDQVTITNIVNWLKERYMSFKGCTAFSFELKHNYSTYLLAAICNKTGFPTLAFNTPNFANDVTHYKLWKTNTFSTLKQHFISSPIHYHMSYIASKENYLLLSDLDLISSDIIRSYHKHFNYDLYPLIDLLPSEIKHLNKVLWYQDLELPELEWNKLTTYDLEWAFKENQKTSKQINQTGILFDSVDPTKHVSQAWLSYTIQQKEIIAKLYVREKKTRHKFNYNKDSSFNIFNRHLQLY